VKPILLLGPAAPGGPPQERWLVEFRPLSEGEEAAAEAVDYSSVIVVNDGGAHTLRRLLAAFAMRERRRQLGIGVLWYLDEADKHLPPLISIGPRLRVELKEEVLQFEYQAV